MFAKKKNGGAQKKKPAHLTEEKEKPAQWIEKQWPRTDRETSGVDRGSSYPENRGSRKERKA